MRNRKNSNNLVMSFILLSLVTASVMVIGATFSFITAYINNDGEGNGDVNLEVGADILVVYTSVEDIYAEGILPGWTDTMTVELKNLSTSDYAIGRYSLNWNIIKNEIINDELVYNVECISEKYGTTTSSNNILISDKEYKVPSISSKIGEAVIAPLDTHTCTINVMFKGLGDEQNYNQGKTFSATVVALPVEMGESSNEEA